MRLVKVEDVGLAVSRLVVERRRRCRAAGRRRRCRAGGGAAAAAARLRHATRSAALPRLISQQNQKRVDDRLNRKLLHKKFTGNRAIFFYLIHEPHVQVYLIKAVWKTSG